MSETPTPLEARLREHGKLLTDTLCEEAADALAALERERDELRLQAQEDLIREVMQAPPSEFTNLEAFKRAWRAEVGKLERENAELRAALEGIASHPHCDYDHPSNGGGQYGIGIADGHRCAANFARRALAGAAPSQEQTDG